jgi:hypothetical protein
MMIQKEGWRHIKDEGARKILRRRYERSDGTLLYSMSEVS